MKETYVTKFWNVSDKLLSCLKALYFILLAPMIEIKQKLSSIYIQSRLDLSFRSFAIGSAINGLQSICAPNV